ncbi:hypothetical protein FISHEDRAFT_73075 [Fistulina hepatica ATCC 64428]|uniref:Uncharacterized protein n=1 Tax=Fistulina hepatica ATCC 64428 TaxID=1128425 RepID=A0A0D7ADN9_9AGAR|nr:hypothetical protein FISHEDRAFT_73075 [Fistulina hepatica ATCC 64428]
MSIYRTHTVVAVAGNSLSFDMEPLRLGGTFQSQQKIVRGGSRARTRYGS